MRKIFHFKVLLIYSFFVWSPNMLAQTVANLIGDVSTTNLNLMLNEFSGEVSTNVGGNTVTILNRVSATGNDLAADYLEEKLNSFGNLTVVSDRYTAGALGGRNIIATQLGKTNPNNIYIICAHYDSVANYCAGDNATGAVAILEVARILSQYCTANTIIYALWDEEEVGLVGSANWVARAVNDGLNILGAINIDMIAYDGDNNDNIPIHSNTNSLSLKDEIVAVLNAHASAIGLTADVQNPGISNSDNGSFWSNNYKSVMLTEVADPFTDLNPNYHTANDRVSNLDLEYFYKISRYIMAIAATKAGLIDNNNCSLGVTERIDPSNILIYPNPATSILNIELKEFASNFTSLQLLNVTGQTIMSRTIESRISTINTENLPNGIYFLKIINGEKSLVRKIIKE